MSSTRERISKSRERSTLKWMSVRGIRNNNPGGVHENQEAKWVKKCIKDQKDLLVARASQRLNKSAGLGQIIVEIQNFNSLGSLNVTSLARINNFLFIHRRPPRRLRHPLQSEWKPWR